MFIKNFGYFETKVCFLDTFIDGNNILRSAHVGGLPEDYSQRSGFEAKF